MYVPAFILAVALLVVVVLIIITARASSEKTRKYGAMVLGVILVSIFAWCIIPGPALKGAKSAAFADLKEHPEILEKLKTGASSYESGAR
jgi:hypothetical protein